MARFLRLHILDGNRIVRMHASARVFLCACGIGRASEVGCWRKGHEIQPWLIGLCYYKNIFLSISTADGGVLGESFPSGCKILVADLI